MGRRKIPKHSRGELECGQILLRMGLNPLREVTLVNLPKYPFDFGFVHNNQYVVLEFDGEQHFTFSQYIHRKESRFKSLQKRDRVKTAHALSIGYKVIRIDHRDILHFTEHVQNALSSANHLYLSNMERYRYLNLF